MRELKCKCNKCGEILDEFDMNNGVVIEKTMGYGSKYDTDKLKLVLCCKCLDDIIEDCTISPIECV